MTMPSESGEKYVYLRAYLKRNNITIATLARELHVHYMTVYYWLQNTIPEKWLAPLRELEARKVAAGEYPQKHKHEPHLAMYRESIANARSKRTPEHLAAAAANSAKTRRGLTRPNTRVGACKRNFDEVAAAELSSAGRKLGYSRFYQTTKLNPGGAGGKWRFVGKRQTYTFD